MVINVIILYIDKYETLANTKTMYILPVDGLYNYQLSVGLLSTTYSVGLSSSFMGNSVLAKCNVI